MLFSFFAVYILLSAGLGALAVPVPSELQSRANPCFITGTTPLPAEVASGLSTLANSITCSQGQSVPGVPEVTSGGVSFASIDFQQSTDSPLGFALKTFSTPDNPATADLTDLQNKLNVYLAVEAGVRSNGGGAILGKVKSVKFFLQFQIARVKTAQGQTLSGAGTVDHQLAKVLKNAVGASAAQEAQVNALAANIG